MPALLTPQQLESIRWVLRIALGEHCSISRADYPTDAEYQEAITTGAFHLDTVSGVLAECCEGARLDSDRYIALSDWEPSPVPDSTALRATGTYRGVQHHVEALPVARTDNGVIIADSESETALLYETFRMDGPPETVALPGVEGREFALFMSPY
jgi:hypothetical protein